MDNNILELPSQKFVNIISNLWIGSKFKVDNLLSTQEIDVLIPLDSLDASVWHTLFEGIIDYCPIDDFSILPQHIENQLVNRIIRYLEDGKSVALFCLGGKGRTGYIASLVLKRMGHPYHKHGVIGYLRENYNNKAVESPEQAVRVAEPIHAKYWVDTININFMFDYGYGGLGFNSFHKPEID